VNKISREKAFLIAMSIAIVALLIGILGVLFIPNIKGLFHKEEPSTKSYEFTENDSNIEINQYDMFDIRFASSGVGDGWNLVSSYDRSTLSLMEGDFKPNFQVWEFYGKAKGTVELTFLKGNIKKNFNVTVKQSKS